MPNWCNNELKVWGDEEQLNKFLEVAKKGLENDKEVEEKSQPLFKLSYFYPYGTENGEWSFDWCVKNWDSKWDCEGTIDDWGGSLFIQFDSPWSPPIKWLEKVVKDFPELEFSLKYDEPGVGFMGVARGTVGEVVDNSLSY